MNSSGFQNGVGKDQVMVTSGNKARYFGLLKKWKLIVTAIEAVAAGGIVIQASLILSGQLYMSQWYTAPNLHETTRI